MNPKSRRRALAALVLGMATVAILSLVLSAGTGAAECWSLWNGAVWTGCR